SLFGSSPLDRRIKGTLMADIFHLVGFRPFDRTALKREERREARHIPGMRRKVRNVSGRPQDAWRRCQVPESIKLAELGEEEKEVIRDTEDEQHRRGHFRVLYPAAEKVLRTWPLFHCPRFLNGVLARWVLTGGLSNPGNRAHIGLTAERLAELGSEGGSGSGAGAWVGGCDLRHCGWEGGDGALRCSGWEETTSDATTVLSTATQGHWLGRPVSSSTANTAQLSSLRRPIGAPGRGRGGSASGRDGEVPPGGGSGGRWKGSGGVAGGVIRRPF
ncbi:unnamed protein product, partial [Discosporangium mesarthrocarpum]